MMAGLSAYNRKRDFRRTREPSGRPSRPRKRGLIFVVQEHHASRLHYDFRLEWSGVLKSWSVPKGPSMEPGLKRLAVEVEDHPVRYATFTGTIPKGEYGGGEVYRWDIGTWEPVGDAAEGLRRGHLDFVLHGRRLTGRWLLVRTRSEAAKPQWLLIKRHDETARAPREALRPAPSKTKRRRRKDPMPDFIEPQLAQLVSKPPEQEGWLHELKFDGYRLQVHARGREVRIFTRNGNDWTARFPLLAQEVASLRIPSAILDGEAVVLDAHGRCDFQRLQNALDAGSGDRVAYHAFDLLYLAGRDLRALPLTERKAALESLLRRRPARHVLYSRHFPVSAGEFLDSSCRLHLEGMVSKRAEAPYVSGRGEGWVKVKCERRQELVIGGFTDPQGTRAHFGALLVGYYEKGVLRYAGKVGTGFNRQTLKSLFSKLARREIRESPFGAGSPSPRKGHWVRPELVAEVAFTEWTADGLLRAPVFQGLREDKPAITIGREKPMAEAREEDPLRILTHPGKILFRSPWITKRDLADYYLAVAPRLLPHAVNRPLSLLRCPDGPTAGCFFQKHFRAGAPPGVRTLRRGARREEDFLSIDSAEGFVSLVQQGAIELHAQNGRSGDPSRPDQIVIDFDPGPRVPWARVRRAAFDLKEILDELGLHSFVKASGGKGLHVHVPIEPAYDESAVKEFARALAEALVARRPNDYVATMNKAARAGKIFVDYLRNGPGSTAIVPYGVRARKGAPVALPISWPALRRLKAGNQFSLADALRSLGGEDPWSGYFQARQRLPLQEAARRAA